MGAATAGAPADRYKVREDGLKADYRIKNNSTSFKASSKEYVDGARVENKVDYQVKANGDTRYKVEYKDGGLPDGVSQVKIDYSEKKDDTRYKVEYRGDDGSVYKYEYRDKAGDAKPAEIKVKTRGDLPASGAFSGGFSGGFGTSATPCSSC